VGARALAPERKAALRVRRLGEVTYEEAWALQRALTRSSDDYLLLLEHPHVYTLGVRADPGHVLVDPASIGASVVTTDRGGDVTYHGPGQLVAYPILTVPDQPDAGRCHVHRLEDVVIRTLGELGLDGRAIGLGRLPGYPGVWLGVHSARPRKVAAVGVRTLRASGTQGGRRTLHGVALNVSCDLAMFGHIVPCGISDLAVTSLQAEGMDVPMDAVVDAFVAQAREGLGGAWVSFDRQDVTSRCSSIPVAVPRGPDRTGRPGGSHGSAGTDSTDRAPVRRLRRAGVDPATAVPLRSPKPPWLRVKAKMGDEYLGLGRALRHLDLVTVCEEAGCPNIYECWSEGTATFMVNGSRCTRACGFCQVDTRHPLPLDPGEPERVAEAVDRMNLAHAVVTCVARDDLDDGGAGAIGETVRAIRRRRPHTRVEVLISDCKGKESAQTAIFESRPDVLNHNIETVARLQRAVRPSAGYARSLAVLARAAEAGLLTKSGLMVGLGETRGEALATMADLQSVGVSIVTVGQYLRPSADHLPVARWWRPEEFDELRAAGLQLGLRHVEASPLTRSSYHARGAAAAAGV
jgi:lipoyl synthase